MSWNEYLAYLSTRWMRRLAGLGGPDAGKAAGDETKGTKEPWSKWWFGLLPMALKLSLQSRFRRKFRFRSPVHPDL